MINDNSGQKINAGDHSINVQNDGNIYINGVTFQECSQIAQDVYDKNFLRFVAEAGEKAKKDAKEVTDYLLKKIGNIVDESVKENLFRLFRDPNVQYGLYNMQKSYVLNGKNASKDMLTDVMLQRLLQNENDMCKVTYNEAMNVMNLLTENHFKVLSIVFLMTCVGEILEQNSFFAYYNLINQLLDETEDKTKIFMYNHLVYTRCVTRSVGEYPFFEWLRENQRWLGLEEINGDKDRNEVNEMIDKNSTLKSMYMNWEDTPLSHLTLTSVGIAIAITYLRTIKIKISYEKWIN